MRVIFYYYFNISKIIENYFFFFPWDTEIQKKSSSVWAYYDECNLTIHAFQKISTINSQSLPTLEVYFTTNTVKYVANYHE